MTAAYRTIPNPIYTITLYPNMATSNPTHSHKTILCTYICSNIQIQSIFLHNILTNSTCTMSGQTLLCSNVLRTCTWKIVFKMENNELNVVWYHLYSSPRLLYTTCSDTKLTHPHPLLAAGVPATPQKSPVVTSND